MSQIAGLQDFRQEGPPADIGTFQLPCSVMVFQHTFAGTTYICAVRSGVRGWVLVDYGTDASTVIQAAVALGGNTLVRSGSYTINTSILIQGVNNVVFEGEGWRSTRLVAGGADVNVILIGDRVNVAKVSRNIIVRGFYIDGTAQTTETVPPEVNDRRFGIEIAAPATTNVDCLIEKNYLYSTGSDSIYGYQAQRCIIQNNIVEGARAYWAGIHVHGSPNDSEILGNILFNCNCSGIRHGHIISGNRVQDCYLGGATGGIEAGIVGAIDAIIADNWIENNDEIAIRTFDVRNLVIGNFARSRYGSLASILVEGDAHHAIIDNTVNELDRCIALLVRNSVGVIVEGNSFKTVGRQGIVIRGSQKCIVSNNYIYAAGRQTNNTYDAILLDDYNATHSISNIITGNQIWSDQANLPRYGINEATADQNYNIIKNNIVANAATTRIRPLGPNTRLEDNDGYNPVGNIATPYPAGAGYLLDVAAAQAFPTSNTNYTVGQSPKFITIYGGTVTSISIDGVATGLTSGGFYLKVGQILNVVWTGQPSSQVYAV